MKRPDRSTGLVYYPDDRPGIRRERRGRGFSYLAPDGTRIARGRERKRLDGLGIPPAYSEVWISPLDNGHLQATGHDDRARKQYRYHAEWTAWQAQQKFEQLIAFGENLPRLRRWIDSRLDDDAGNLETAIAATLALMDRASLRMGSQSYTRANGSYGATTLQNEHVETDGKRVTLEFIGKGGAEVDKDFYAPKLARVLEESQDLPGAAVLNWIDAEGEPRAVRSEHINSVIADLCGEGITAKTFRTWNGTHAAFQAARRADKLTIKAMAEAAAERLHNTPGIARNSYIHPKVIDLAEADGDMPQISDDGPDGLRAGEAALLRFLGEG